VGRPGDGRSQTPHGQEAQHHKDCGQPLRLNEPLALVHAKPSRHIPDRDQIAERRRYTHFVARSKRKRTAPTFVDGRALDVTQRIENPVNVPSHGRTYRIDPRAVSKPQHGTRPQYGARPQDGYPHEKPHRRHEPQLPAEASGAVAGSEQATEHERQQHATLERLAAQLGRPKGRRT
jgi:hypothetical protein